MNRIRCSLVSVHEVFVNETWKFFVVLPFWIRVEYLGEFFPGFWCVRRMSSRVVSTLKAEGYRQVAWEELTSLSAYVKLWESILQ